MTRRWLLVLVALGLAALVFFARPARERPLLELARTGREPALVKAIRAAKDPALRDHDGRTVLHHAAERGFAKAVVAMLERGAEVESVDLQGLSPLYLAARAGRVNTVYGLLAGGADASRATGPSRAQPLHAAAEFRHVDVARLLLRAGVDVDARNRFGQSPLLVAASNGWHGDAAMVTFLLDEGADPHAVDGDGFDAVRTAAFYNNLEVVRALRKRGTDLGARTLRGSTARDLANERFVDSVAQELFEADAPLGRLVDPVPPLVSAAAYDDVDRIVYLLGNGFDAERPHAGKTALEVARASGSEGAAAVLSGRQVRRR